MIVIKVELWPGGNEARAQEIARGRIANDGTGTLASGNYRAAFTSEVSADRYLRKADIQNFPRRRKNVWELIRRALEAANERMPL